MSVTATTPTTTTADDDDDEGGKKKSGSEKKVGRARFQRHHFFFFLRRSFASLAHFSPLGCESRRAAGDRINTEGKEQRERERKEEGSCMLAEGSFFFFLQARKKKENSEESTMSLALVLFHSWTRTNKRATHSAGAACRPRPPRARWKEQTRPRRWPAAKKQEESALNECSVFSFFGPLSSLFCEPSATLDRSKGGRRVERARLLGEREGKKRDEPRRESAPSSQEAIGR